MNDRSSFKISNTTKSSRITRKFSMSGRVVIPVSLRIRRPTFNVTGAIRPAFSFFSSCSALGKTGISGVFHFLLKARCVFWCSKNV